MLSQKTFHTILEWAQDLKNKPVSEPKSPHELKELFDLKLKEDSLKSEEDLHSILQDVFKYSVNTQSSKFLNQLYGGSQEVAWLSELIVAILNTSMATYEIAPLFTLMEKELLSKINERLNFAKMDGLMVPGGSYANMYALHCARHEKLSQVKEKGLSDFDKAYVFVSEAAHYSSEKSMNLLGMGTSQLVKIPVDKNKKMKPDALKNEIQRVKEQEGGLPICVVSTAGTTVWGSFDSVSEIQKVCEEFDLWHHVDAAWGGLALWSEEDKETLFKDIKKVDSITLDFHKLMSSTLTKAFFICSKPDVFYQASSGGGSAYIFHKEEEDEAIYDTGAYAIQCGRKVDSLSLWLQWKLDGTQQFKNKYEELKTIRDGFVNRLTESSEDFKLLHKPEFMNVCFQVLPDNYKVSGYDKTKLANFNKILRQRLLETGEFMVNFSKDEENGAFFRLVLNHWGVSESDLSGFLKKLKTLKSQLS